MERRSREFQCPPQRASGPRLAAAQPRICRLAAAGVEPLQHPDRAARLDRRVLRRLCRAQRDPDRSVSRSMGIHQPRLSAPACYALRGRLFENAEGNFGMANAMLRFFAEKLPISRWQRDLTDSTVLRNLGVALAHSLIGWKALQRGLTKLTPDQARMAQDLEGAYEVLGEAIQSVLRAAGVPDGYERLKEFTRGQSVDAARLAAFVATLPLVESERRRLSALRPGDYVGLAAQLARRFAAEHEIR